jgi:hypothetical protein
LQPFQCALYLRKPPKPSKFSLPSYSPSNNNNDQSSSSPLHVRHFIFDSIIWYSIYDTGIQHSACEPSVWHTVYDPDVQDSNDAVFQHRIQVLALRHPVLSSTSASATTTKSFVLATVLHVRLPNNTVLRAATLYFLWRAIDYSDGSHRLQYSSKASFSNP